MRQTARRRNIAKASENKGRVHGTGNDVDTETSAAPEFLRPYGRFVSRRLDRCFEFLIFQRIIRAAARIVPDLSFPSVGKFAGTWQQASSPGVARMARDHDGGGGEFAFAVRLSVRLRLRGFSSRKSAWYRDRPAP